MSLTLIVSKPARRPGIEECESTGGGGVSNGQVRYRSHQNKHPDMLLLLETSKR